MKKLILFFASVIAAAQTNNSGFHYSSTSGNVSLSGTGYNFTIQQPKSGGSQVTFDAAVIYCSVACNLTQSQNGTPATATAGTVNPLLPFGPNSVTTVWTSSNVGNGTAAGGILALQAGIPQTLIMGNVSLPPTNSNTNYTFTISSITGTANVTVYWREQ